MRTKQLLFCIVSCGAMVACAPLPLYRLQPVAETKRWLQGRELVYVSQDGIEAEIAFDRTAGRNLVFEVWIRNRDAESFCAAPEQFYYLPMRTPQDSILTQKKRYHALDPESRIGLLDKEVAKENADHATSAALDATVTVLDLVQDLATLNKPKSKEQIAQEEDENREREEVWQNRERAHDSKLARLQSERADWQFEALRKTTLAEGESCGGFLYFPAPETPRTNFLKLVLPLGATEMEFLFELHTTKP